MTQEDLAYDADVTISALSRVERGLSNPTWRTIRRLATALGVSLTELATAIQNEQDRRGDAAGIGNCLSGVRPSDV
jgi:transcriptional regulator with XRE-family HTH domain